MNITEFTETYLNLIIRQRYPKPFTLELKKHFPQTQLLTGCEIGVWKGENAKSMLQELPNLKTLYLVDPYIEYDNYNEHTKTKTNLETAYKEALHKLETTKFTDRIKWIKALSESASQKIPDEELDFVYIDGNHSYEYIKKDIELWLPKIKVTGLIGGDDIQTYDVLKAVVEEFGTNFAILGSDWVAIRQKCSKR